MKKTTSRLTRLSLALAAGLALCTGAQADTSWGITFGGTDGGNATTTYSSSGVNLTISGDYAANNGNSGFSASSWTSGTVTYYSGNGLAMSSDGSAVPNHALDNSGNTEAVLLHFTSGPVTLSQIGLGYVCTGTAAQNGTGTNCDSNGADISLLAYTGNSSNPLSGVAPGSTDGKNGTTAVNNGWSLVGNYADLTVDKTSPYSSVNAGNVASSWWLISAYNSDFGTTSSNGGSLNQGDDYFKIFAVAGTACTSNCGTGGKPVSEPASLALASLALMGVFFSRRKKA